MTSIQHVQGLELHVCMIWFIYQQQYISYNNSHIQEDKLLVVKKGQIIAHVLIKPNPLLNKYFGTNQFRKINKTKYNEFTILQSILKKNKNQYSTMSDNIPTNNVKYELCTYEIILTWYFIHDLFNKWLVTEFYFWQPP